MFADACGKNVSGDPAHERQTFFKKIKDSPGNEGCQKVHQTDSNQRPHDPTLSPLDQRLQLPNRRKIFGIYALPC